MKVKQYFLGSGKVILHKALHDCMHSMTQTLTFDGIYYKLKQNKMGSEQIEVFVK